MILHGRGIVMGIRKEAACKAALLEVAALIRKSVFLFLKTQKDIRLMILRVRS